MMDKILTWIGGVILVGALVLLLAFIWSFITLWAWNITMPFIFHLPQINLSQAFGLTLLANLIKGSTSITKK